MSKNVKVTTVLSCLGVGLEYYDFVIYGMMANILSILFFGSESPVISQLKAFAIFAVGYLARPIGGVLFGMLGDAYGRKRAFSSVMLLMVISTLGIGLLPTYEEIGVSATLLLVLLRVMQGLSFGAELPGAITVVGEHVEQKKHASFSSLLISSVSIGSLLASLVTYLLTDNMSHEKILNWGWRIPFLLGGSLAIVNFFIRKYLQETPEFSKLQETRPPVALKELFFDLIRNYLFRILSGMGMMWFFSVLVIFWFYLPTYLTEHFYYASKDVYIGMMWGMLWSCVFLPVSGRLVDYLGKMQVFLAVSLGFVLFGFLLFFSLSLQSFAVLIAFMLLYQTMTSLLAVSYYPLLLTLFPTKVRYTGIALCYNVSYSIAGCLPFFMTSMIHYLAYPSFGVWFLVASALFSAISGLFWAYHSYVKAETVRYPFSDC